MPSPGSGDPCAQRPSFFSLVSGAHVHRAVQGPTDTTCQEPPAYCRSREYKHHGRLLTARAWGEGLVPSSREWSLERADKCPSSLSCSAGAASRKAPQAQGGEASSYHRRPCPQGPGRGEQRGPEEMHTAPSQSPRPLEPETKDPVTKNSSPQTVASFLQASHDLLGNE